MTEQTQNINIHALDDIIKILKKEGYDFVTFEPGAELVKIDWRKDKEIVKTDHINAVIYKRIKERAKELADMDVGVETETQEGKKKINIGGQDFLALVKTVPNKGEEKMFFKIKKAEEKKKVESKVKTSQLIGFFAAVLVIILILGGGFLTFVVLNANGPEDLSFFNSLGINLNEINNLIGQLVKIVFSILLFIEIIGFVAFIFRAFLTKKSFKRKRLNYFIISALIFILTFASASAWLYITKKVNELPEWEIMALGEIQIYDNAKLTSDAFGKQQAYMVNTKDLIGPIELNFDLNVLKKKEEKNGIKITKYIMDFGDGTTEDKLSPNFIHTYNKKGIYETSLTLELTDQTGKIVSKKIKNTPQVHIAYLVDIQEKLIPTSGGKIITLNASTLKELGKPTWYSLSNLDTPIYEGNIYITPKPIFKETPIGLSIKKDNTKKKTLDRIFVIGTQEKEKINGELLFERSPIDDKIFTFYVDNIKNDTGIGYIEEYIWKIGSKEYRKIGEVDDVKGSSAVKHRFGSYGEFNVSVSMITTSGEEKTLSNKININKEIKLTKDGIDFYADEKKLQDIKYLQFQNEYYIENLGIPTKLKLDARFIKPDSYLYTIEKISWDFDSNGTIDQTGKVGEYEIIKTGSHIVTVHYDIKNKKIPTDIKKISQKVYIESVNKEAIVDFEIKKSSDYVPVIVGFDASKSSVKGENISKFIWNFGDGIREERDSVVYGHKYIKKGEYKVTLQVITESGKKYSTSKRLILKPTAQTIKATASMKTAPTYQGIDFTSSESDGDIIEYFWDFGDGNISQEANPTHEYTKSGNYKVKLRLEFRNRDIQEDYIDIKIVD